MFYDTCSSCNHKEKTASNHTKGIQKMSQELRHHFLEKFSEGDKTQNPREETDPSREKQRESCKFRMDLGMNYTIETATIISLVNKYKS